MNIEKVYLLLSVSYDNEKVNHGKQEIPMYPLLDGNICFSDSNGEFSGSSCKLLLKPNIKNEFWKNNCSEIMIFENFKGINMKYLTLFYSLNPVIIDEISDIKSSERYKLKKELFVDLINETFPNIEELSMSFDDSNKNKDDFNVDEILSNYKLLITNSNYDSLWELNNNIELLDSYLIIVPSKEELKDLNDKIEEPQDFLLRFENSINRDIKKTVIIPYYYLNYIETIPILVARFAQPDLRILICTKSNHISDQIVIPKSISDLHAFDITLYKLREIEKKLSGLYANNRDIKEYIHKITERNMFEIYASNFKNERLNLIQSKFEIEEIVTSFKNLTKYKFPYYFRDYIDKYQLKTLSDSTNTFAYTLIQNRINDFDKLISNIESKTIVITRKDSYINEYLRDIISEESMKLNLELQGKIKRLTNIALIIGILSLILSIFNNEIKELLIDCFSKLFN